MKGSNLSFIEGEGMGGGNWFTALTFLNSFLQFFFPRASRVLFHAMHPGITASRAPRLSGGRGRVRVNFYKIPIP